MSAIVISMKTKYLDVQYGDLVVVEEVPDLHISVHPSGEEDRDLGGTPPTPRQPRHAGFHPHDGGRLQVLAPDFAGHVANCQEVLRIERVPSHSFLNKIFSSF